MGLPESKFFCEDHEGKGADAYCVQHKKLVCLSCIVKKTHFEANCKLREIDEMKSGMLECIVIQQGIKRKNKILIDKIDSNNIQTEIEDAYAEALANLENIRVASYKTMRENVAKIKAREDESTNKILQKLDEAIECYDAGNKREADHLRMEIRQENICWELDFETVDPFVDKLQSSLVKIEETHSVVGNEELDYSPVHSVSEESLDESCDNVSGKGPQENI